MSQAFISYASEDRPAAERLWSDLYNRGVRAWLDVHNLTGGQLWRQLIDEAIWQSSHFILLLSRRAVSKRGFVQREMRQAIERMREIPPGDIFLIPCRLEECTPRHQEILEVQWIDLFPVYEEGLFKLLRALDADDESQRPDDNEFFLRQYRSLFDRPAFSTPCIFESALPAIRRALETISEALATGAYRSRSGQLLKEITPASSVSSTKVRDVLLEATEGLRSVNIHVARLEGELKRLEQSVPNSHLHFLYMGRYIKELYDAGVPKDTLASLIPLMDSVDASRNAVIERVNRLFASHGISPIPRVRLSSRQIALSETIDAAGCQRSSDRYGMYHLADWKFLQDIALAPTNES